MPPEAGLERAVEAADHFGIGEQVGPDDFDGSEPIDFLMSGFEHLAGPAFAETLQ